MADPPSAPEPDGSTPRWVKVSGIIALAIGLLLLILLLAGGDHGPGRHQSSRGPGGFLPSGATAARDGR